MRHLPGQIAIAVLLLAIAGPVAAYAEDTGTSCADCQSADGEFTLKNGTNSTIHYQVKWGKKGDWANANQMELRPGLTMTHSFGLDGNGKAPIPRIRLDIDTTGNNNTQEKELEFGAVQRTGSGHSGEPVHYLFFVKDHNIGLEKLN
jgi:hypothetical protein